MKVEIVEQFYGIPNSDDSFLMTIYSNGEEIGEIQARKEDLNRHWLYLYMEKKYRKRGYMSKYLPRFLKEIKREGVKILLAQARNSNKISQHILEKNNFFKATKGKKAIGYIKIL